MTEKSRDKDVFDSLYKVMQGTGVKTYPELPMNEVPYPFGYIDEIQIVPRSTKQGLLGTVFVTAHIFADRNQRTLLGGYCEKMFTSSGIVKLQKCTLRLRANASDYRIISERGTTNSKDGSSTYNILHGFISME